MSFIPDPDFTQPARNVAPQPSTIQYTTFVKRALVEATQDAFAAHVSQRVQATKVAVSFSQDKYTLPAVVINFYERSNMNAGVGHQEWLPSPYDDDPTNPSTFMKYYHRMYNGDISFDIYAQSSTDLGLVRDAVVEILTTTDATEWGNVFIQRMYYYLNSTPYGLWHFPVLNTDTVSGFGETQAPLPWAPEDKLCYKASYRIPIYGEYYSATPTQASGYGGFGLLTEVDLTVTEVVTPTQSFEDFYTFDGYPDDWIII